MGKYDPDNPALYESTTSATPPSSGGKYAPSSEPIKSAEAPPGTNRTWWDTARSAGQTADDAVRAAANVLTFGMADRLAGLTSEGGTDAQVKLSEEARKRSPYASVAGDVAGAVALPGLGGARLAARMGSGLGARAAGFGAEGAAIGAGQGAGTTYTGNPLDYVKNAATGGLMGGVLGAGVGGAFGPRAGPRSTAEVPSTDRLFQEKRTNYGDLERSPVPYDAGAFARAADPVEATLRRRRYTADADSAPTTFRAVEEMRAPPTTAHLGQGAPVYPGDIEAIRQGMTHINPVTASTDRGASRVVKEALEQFMINPPPGAVMPGMEGAAREAAQLATRARGNNAAYRRGEFWDDIVDAARTDAGSTYSGLNFQNKVRQGAASAVRRKKGESPASRAGLNDDEINALTNFARVPFGDATLRYADKFLGGGGGLGALAAGSAGGGLGYYLDNATLGGTLAAAAPAAGLGLRLLGNRRANQNVNALGDMIRQRSPLYQERAAVAPMGPHGGQGSQMLRDAITVGLIKQGFGQTEGEDDPLRITVRPR